MGADLEAWTALTRRPNALTPDLLGSPSCGLADGIQRLTNRPLQLLATDSEREGFRQWKGVQGYSCCNPNHFGSPDEILAVDRSSGTDPA